MVNQNFIPRTYTPKKKNYYRRDNHEELFRRLYKEHNKTPFISDLSYLTDNDLLISINGYLDKLGLVKMTDEELNRPLSLKN